MIVMIRPVSSMICNAYYSEGIYHVTAKTFMKFTNPSYSSEENVKIMRALFYRMFFSPFYRTNCNKLKSMNQLRISRIPCTTTNKSISSIIPILWAFCYYWYEKHNKISTKHKILSFLLLFRRSNNSILSNTFLWHLEWCNTISTY